MRHLRGQGHTVGAVSTDGKCDACGWYYDTTYGHECSLGQGRPSIRAQIAAAEARLAEAIDAIRCEAQACGCSQRIMERLGERL